MRSNYEIAFKQMIPRSPDQDHLPPFVKIYHLYTEILWKAVREHFYSLDMFYEESNYMLWTVLNNGRRIPLWKLDINYGAKGEYCFWECVEK